MSLSEELTSLIWKSRETYNRTRSRRRNIILSLGIIIILLLSVFSIWALKERDRAEGLKVKAQAEKYNLLATNIAIHDPTKGLRIAEYAYSFDSNNQSILGNIKRIYSDNAFYTLIAKQEDAVAKQEDAIYSVSFSPDGKNILTGSGEATARLWDLNGNLIKIYIGHVGYVNSVAFAPDGLSILTGSTDRTARLWDLNGKVIRDFKGHSMSVNSVAFSPDGKEILTGSTDRTARLWDLAGNVIQEFKGHKSGVTTVAFSPNGKKILTGSVDQTAILWDLNGNIDQVFSGYKSYVTSVAFSPDGQNILIGMVNGSVRLYPVKMPYQDFNKINKYEQLSSFDKLLYNIIDINSVRNSKDEKILLRASEYNLNEAIQSGTSEKNHYLNNAIELYNKLLKENPEKKEYLFDLLRANVYDYKANPTDNTKKEIEKINDKILSFTSIDDLTLASYTYCIICIKNDSILIPLGIPDCFFGICRKLMTCSGLPVARREDISRWCSYVSTDLIQNKEFAQALQSIQVAQLSDSTNIEIPAILPFVYIFNNQYDKVVKIINKFKNKSLTGYNNFKSYGEVYRYSIDLLENRAITHPDFAKAKELLKN